MFASIENDQVVYKEGYLAFMFTTKSNENGFNVYKTLSEKGETTKIFPKLVFINKDDFSSFHFKGLTVNHDNFSMYGDKGFMSNLSWLLNKTNKDGTVDFVQVFDSVTYASYHILSSQMISYFSLKGYDFDKSKLTDLNKRLSEYCTENAIGSETYSKKEHFFKENKYQKYSSYEEQFKTDDSVESTNEYKDELD